MKKIKRNWIVCHLGQSSDESSEKCKLRCEKKLQTHDQNGHHCVGSTLHYMVALLYTETEDTMWTLSLIPRWEQPGNEANKSQLPERWLEHVLWVAVTTSDRSALVGGVPSSSCTLHPLLRSPPTTLHTTSPTTTPPTGSSKVAESARA